jgi:hypothetical protein
MQLSDHDSSLLTQNWLRYGGDIRFKHTNDFQSFVSSIWEFISLFNSHIHILRSSLTSPASARCLWIGRWASSSNSRIHIVGSFFQRSWTRILHNWSYRILRPSFFSDLSVSKTTSRDVNTDFRSHVSVTLSPADSFPVLNQDNGKTSGIHNELANADERSRFTRKARTLHELVSAEDQLWWSLSRILTEPPCFPWLLQSPSPNLSQSEKIPKLSEPKNRPIATALWFTPLKWRFRSLSEI